MSFELDVIVAAIRSERAYQKAIWGDDSQNGKLSPDFILYMEYYIPRLIEATRLGTPEILNNMRKLVTLGFAMFEILGQSDDMVLESIKNMREAGRDYSGLPLSVYILRIETGLFFARKAAITTGGEKDLKSWVLDIINHGLYCFQEYGISLRN